MKLKNSNLDFKKKIDNFNNIVTIAIPTKNNLPTIKIVLNVYNYQMIYPKILILDNGSRDGTLEALEALIKNKIFPDLDIRLINFGEWSGDKEKNLDKIRYELCQRINTKYIFFNDSDVLIPPYVLPSLINEMEKDKKLGMLGLKYDMKANHVKIGAAIIRTELAKQIQWNRDDEKCNCLCAIEKLKEIGFEVKEYDEALARHLLAF